MFQMMITLALTTSGLMLLENIFLFPFHYIFLLIFTCIHTSILTCANFLAERGGAVVELRKQLIIQQLLY